MKREMVAGLIIKDGKLLLVHNKKHGAVRIEPPGGKKHSGESSMEAVVREVEEELGIKCRPEKFFGAYDTSSPEGDFSVRMYLCDIVSGEPRIVEPDKIPEFGWYSFKELEACKALVPNMIEALPKLKEYL